MCETFQRKMRQIGLYENRARDLRKGLEDQERCIAELQREIIEDIRADTLSSGDRISDLVISFHGKVGDKVLDRRYRELEAALRGKQGEFVLVLHRETEWMEKHGTTAHGFGIDHQYYRLGVLGSETIKLIKGCGFGGDEAPSIDVSRFVEGEIEPLSMPSTLSVVNGNIFGRHMGPRNITPLFHLLQDDNFRWQDVIVIGDAAVKEFLEESHMTRLFKVAGDALGKLILTPTDEDTVA